MTFPLIGLRLIGGGLGMGILVAGLYGTNAQVDPDSDWSFASGSTLLLGQRYELPSESSHGLPITYSVEHGPAVIVDQTLRVTDLGTVVLRATEAGRSEGTPYSVTRTFNRSRQEYQQIGDYSPGEGVIRDIEVQGDLAFLAYDKFDVEGLHGVFSEGALAILDVTDVTKPVKLSEYASGGAGSDIVVRDEIVYLAAGDAGMAIINVQDPERPTRVGLFDSPCWGVEVHGDYAYLMEHDVLNGGGRDFVIVDVSIPEEPRFVRALELSDSRAGFRDFTRNLTFEGNHAFIATGRSWFLDRGDLAGGNVTCFDVSNPAQPQLVESWRDPTNVPLYPDRCRFYGGAWEIDVVGNLLYLANGLRGLEIHDLSSEEVPRVGLYETEVEDDLIRNVRVDGVLAHVVVNQSDVRVLDIAEPDDPVLAGGFDPGRFVTRLDVTTNHIYAGGVDLRIYSRKPARLVPELQWRTPVKVGVGEGSLPLSAASDSGLGLEFEVISGPARLEGTELQFTRRGLVTVQVRHSEENDQFESAEWIREIEIVPQRQQTLTWIAPAQEPVVSFGSPYHLEATASSGLPVQYSVVTGPGLVNGDVLELTGLGPVTVKAEQIGNSEFEPVRSTTVVNPSESFDVEVTGVTRVPGAKYMDAVGRIAYVTTWSDQLFIVDYEDPWNPVILSEFDPEVDLRRIQVQGNYVYAATGSEVLLIDVSDPRNPFRAGSYRSPGLEFLDAKVEGDVGYFLARQPGGLEIVDLSNPLEPKRLSFLPLDRPRDKVRGFVEVQVSNGFAYLRSDYGVIEIAEVRDPMSPRRWGNFGYASHNLHVVGDVAYLTYNRSLIYRRLSIFDVRSPTQPRTIGKHEVVYCLPGNVFDEFTEVHAMGNLAAVSLGSELIQVFDLSDLAAPRLVETLELFAENKPFSSRGSVFAEGDLLYLIKRAGAGVETGVEAVQLTYPKHRQALMLSQPRRIDRAQPLRELPSHSNRGLPISYSLVSGPARVDGNRLRVTGDGAVVVRAAQEGNEQFLPASVEWEFSVTDSRPRILIGREDEGGLRLEVVVPEGAVYVIQWRPDLADEEWETVTQVRGTGNSWSLPIEEAGQPHRFYRVLVQE